MFDDNYNRFDTILALVGQTDGHTETPYKYHAVHPAHDDGAIKIVDSGEPITSYIQSDTEETGT